MKILTERMRKEGMEGRRGMKVSVEDKSNDKDDKQFSKENKLR